ncbi:PRC-barrel domain-containing protein [Microbacterium sp. 22242]|uniref:PRC-barrel domain-containing protein n=1 Tax=Microbacterium sp. 22242 TaxID=3453896 RepID=UPI003F86E8D6
MIERSDVNSLFDAKVVGGDDEKVGTVTQVYLDNDTGEPLFVGVVTGLFGTSHAVIPLRDASFDREVLHVGYDKAAVKDAPHIDDREALSVGEEDRIWAYYDDLDHGADEEDASRRADRDRGDAAPRSRRLRRHVVPLPVPPDGAPPLSEAPVIEEPVVEAPDREEPAREVPAREAPFREEGGRPVDEGVDVPRGDGAGGAAGRGVDEGGTTADGPR